LVGVGMVGVWTVLTSGITWLILKYTIGIRVSEAEEVGGLDHGEHGNDAYHGFVMQTPSHG
ncbi:MAG: hypothetical protein RLZZ458_3758, partial [Planctomycetota bacterium]